LKPGLLTTEFLGPHAIAAALLALAWAPAEPVLVRACAALGAALAVVAYPAARSAFKAAPARTQIALDRYIEHPAGAPPAADPPAEPAPRPKPRRT